MFLTVTAEAEQSPADNRLRHHIKAAEQRRGGLRWLMVDQTGGTVFRTEQNGQQPAVKRGEQRGDMGDIGKVQDIAVCPVGALTGGQPVSALIRLSIQKDQAFTEIPLQCADRDIKLTGELCRIQRFTAEQAADNHGQPERKPVMA